MALQASSLLPTTTGKTSTSNPACPRYALDPRSRRLLLRGIHLSDTGRSQFQEREVKREREKDKEKRKAQSRPGFSQYQIEGERLYSTGTHWQ
ncbi:hypothetical protein K435DRAFT_845108, partial [Dendrothele bispora CBS 962.96]